MSGGQGGFSGNQMGGSSSGGMGMGNMAGGMNPMAAMAMGNMGMNNMGGGGQQAFDPYAMSQFFKQVSGVSDKIIDGDCID